MYAPSVSLPKSDDVVNDGSVQVAPPAEVGGGVTGVEAGAEAVGVAVGWVGEAVGDVPGAEADGDDDEMTTTRATATAPRSRPSAWWARSR